MNKTLIALPAGKATGLSAYRQGAAQAVEVLDRIRAQARAGEAVAPHWLADALDSLPPDSRRGFLVVVACYAAAGAVADDFAVRRKVSALINRKITEGGFA
jgi:hypothetical protein